MWSEQIDDGYRRRELLTTAGDSNPFTPIIHRFYSFDKHLTNKDFDEIHTALSQLPELKALYETLATEQPRFTGIFRFDPSSIHFTGQEGCFSDRVPMGASTAYGRVFEKLTIDKIQTIQTKDEVMVVVAQPSYLITSDEAPRLDEEPTVLFTSRLFENGPIDPYDAEEFQLGMVIKHGDSPFDVRPFPSLSTPKVERDYIRYAAQFAQDITQ